MTIGRQNTLHEFMTGRATRKSLKKRKRNTSNQRSFSLRRATLAQTLSLPSTSFYSSNDSLHFRPVTQLPGIPAFTRRISLGPSGIPLLILAVECLKRCNLKLLRVLTALNCARAIKQRP